MDICDTLRPVNAGMVYRLNGGFGWRVAGDNAKNDGILATLEVGYQSPVFWDRFSIESGTSLDLFGETEHLAAYLQFNYHLQRRWTLSLHTMAGGVSDDKEKTAVSDPNSSGEDKQDFGGITHGALQISYRADQNFFLGFRAGMEWQLYGKSGGDQGTQLSLFTLLNLAYHY